MTTIVPERLLAQQVTVVRPATVVDAYNNTTLDYGAGATRTPITAWLQQEQRTEQFRDGRDPLDERWLMITNASDILGIDRIEWADHPRGAVVFELDGPPEPAYTPSSLHHYEATLRLVQG